MKILRILLTNILVIISFLVYGQTTIYVTQNETWTTPRTCYEIVIGNFATLTIKNTTVKMQYRIVVNPSGKLIVDNSTITHDVQFTSYWRGIDIGCEYCGVSDIKASVEIKNSSLIQWANIGVDMYYDGNLSVSGNSTFFNNRYGIHLRLWKPLGQDFGNPTISIQNTNFSAIDYAGIEVHGEAGTLDIVNCKFSDNPWYGIIFRDDYSGDIINTVRDCSFLGNYVGIGCLNLNNLKIINCNFQKSQYGSSGIGDGIESTNSKELEIVGNNFEGISKGINASNSKGLEIIGNSFKDLSIAGISSSESEFYAHDQNIFESCSTGIFASAAETSSHFTLENNYFVDCQNGVDISGYDDWKATKIFNNTFEVCEFTIYASGSNHFSTVENLLVNCDYNILVNSTGEDQNLIGCNEINDPESGMQIHFNNEMTTFVGNQFNRTGWSDVLLRAADINDNIGDEDFPALNTFSDHGDDITLWAGGINTDPFTYWLPKDPADNIDPDNIPVAWKDQAHFTTLIDCDQPQIPELVDDQTLLTWKEDYCYWYEMYKNEDNITNKVNYYTIKEKLLRYLYYHLHPEFLTEWQRVEAIMKNYCDWWRFQKYQVKYYLTLGECNKVDSILNVIELSLRDEPYNNTSLYQQEIQSKQAFVNIYRIILSKQCDLSRRNVDGEFVFTTNEINLLYTEAQKNIPEAGYARALYYTATGQILPNNSFIEIGSDLPDTIVLRTNTDTMPLVYPNPTSEIINITYNRKVVADVILSDVFGKVVYEQKVDFSDDNGFTIDVSNLNSNVYFLTITDNEGQIEKIEKIVINKN